jgi:4-amino-4-deoxy-L-arabinose transferase-like glycosyltransferase
MSDSSESKRLWRTALIVAGVGLLVLVPLSWLALRMYDDTIQRRVMSANESAALGSLEAIQAAEQLYYETNGQYATFQQLLDSGIFQAELQGDPPVAHGYTFALRVQPKTEAQAPAYSVNADPVRAEGRDATGRRHFFISSEVIGVRFNESRPATKDDKPRPTVREY